MNILTIMNLFDNEQTAEFASRMKTADHMARIANECNATLKATAKDSENYKAVREASIIASADKADAIKAVQELVDYVYIKEVLKGENPVDCFRVYFSDPFRPVLSIKGKNNTVSWEAEESLSMYSFKAVVGAINEAFKETMKTMDIRTLFMDARAVSSAYVLHQCLSNAETMKTYKAEYLSQFGESDAFIAKENCGRNKAEKTMQAIIDTLLGLTDEQKVTIRVTKDFILEFYLFDHGFDRDNKTGNAYLVDNDTFMERLAMKIHKVYTGKADIAIIKK